MKAWSEFYPDVRPELPLAPLPLIDHWLRDTAIDFCQRSKVRVVDLAAIDSVADQGAYALTPPAESAIVEVRAVRFQGDRLTLRSPDYLEDRYDEWTTESGTPCDYTQEATDTLVLVPKPSAGATDAITIKAAVRPSDDATGIDDWLFVRYRLALAAGAKARAMFEEGKPWSKPNRALELMAIYTDAVLEAKVDQASGFGRARPRFSGEFC